MTIFVKKDPRYNNLMVQPTKPCYRVCIIQFQVSGHPLGGTDKDAHGNRPDSIPIANGCIKAGAHCDIIMYDAFNHDDLEVKIMSYDGIIVRINPGHLSQGTPTGTQQRFDETIEQAAKKGKVIFSSTAVKRKMGAKDALVKIRNMNCGLSDTFAYYSPEELEKGFKTSCAFQPRVIKQNRGSCGEGIWLVWLVDKQYCDKYGESMLDDDDKLKLVEMSDNHIEYHTVREFLTFCVFGAEDERAGIWKSYVPGKYLEGGREAGAQLVDQRFLPRISEGEVRNIMVGDICTSIIHKKPVGGFSAVGGNSEYTYYSPDDPKFASLISNSKADLPELFTALELVDEPLPLLWTVDYIPVDFQNNNGINITKYVVGEFNCSCVGVSKFMAVCGNSTIADISDEDYYEGTKITDLVGQKVLQALKKKTG